MRALSWATLFYSNITVVHTSYFVQTRSLYIIHADIKGYQNPIIYVKIVAFQQPNSDGKWSSKERNKSIESSR